MTIDNVPDSVVLSHNADARRYELSVDGEIASVANYRDRGDVVVFPHTVTAPRFQGNGFAEQVVRFALNDVRGRGKRVVASCWFVSDFISNHPEYGDLVATEPDERW